MGNPANRLVVKSNDLIQRSRFSLSLQQQRIVLFLISKISDGDQSFKEYQFKVSDFCALCGLNQRSGKHYQDIKDDLQAISDRSMWVTIDGDETLVRWIEKPKINKKTGKISVRLDSDMMPFLLQLKENFTRYELFWTLRFRSKFSHRLYELIKSVYFNSLDPYTYVFDLPYLKERMDANQYKTWQDFKARALEPAIVDINTYSDLTVSYETVRSGHSVTKIMVRMETKDALERVRMQCTHDHDLYSMLSDQPDEPDAQEEGDFEPLD